MRKREIGQAFILVLILLGIGALLVVPALRLTGTSLKSSQIVERQVKGLYAADAGQEWVLWSLTQPGWVGENLTLGVPEDFEIDVCGTPVDITIVMIAVESTGGLVLYGDDVIQPTKTVACEGQEPPNENKIPNDWSGTVTYTICLDQLTEPEPTDDKLEVIYDILPKTFGVDEFVSGSCRLTVDGVDFGQFPDPLVESEGWGGQVRLRWPNPESYPFSDIFTSDPTFKGIQNFTVRQVKELSFEMEHTFKGLDKDKTHCNWVVLMPWKTLSGPQASIVVGDADPGQCNFDVGLIETTKKSDPRVIDPFEEQHIRYTITVTNHDGFVQTISSITDYLPAGFHYSTTPGDPPPDGTVLEGRSTVEPTAIYTEEFNTILREVVQWEFAAPVLNIDAGGSLTLSFSVVTTKDVSGYFFNEVVLDTSISPPGIFVDDIGITQEEFNRNYSWATGEVLVPAFDSETEADGTTIDANLSLIPGGVAFTSWHVD